MRSCLLVVRHSWMFLMLGTPALVAAQQQGDMDSLSKAFAQNESRRKELLDGTTQPGATDKKIAEAAAKWYIWRITHVSVLSDPTGKKVSQVYFEFNTVVDNAMYKDRVPKNRAFINMLGAELVDKMKEALAGASADPRTQIHTAMMLPTMAKLKQDNVSDYLMELVSDAKTPDVIRLNALKALKETMPVGVMHDNNNDLKAVIARKPRDVKLVDTLAKYIDTPLPVDGLHAEEVAALRYLRREAIIALANAEAPAVSAMKNKKLEGPVAPTLLRVLAKKLDPEPSLQEMIEAAIGVCKIKYAEVPEYQPEVGVYLVAKTLEEFIKEYNRDYANFVGKKEKLAPRVAFKTEAKRFELALKDLSDNAKGSSAKTKADNLKVKTTPLLLKIYAYQQVDDNEFRAAAFMKSLRPTKGYVFNTLKTAEIPLDGE